jgi:hypothetical protein
MCTSRNVSGLMFISSCLCGGTGCGGHLVLNQLDITPIGWQGAAQHTYTPACAGHHAPGPCPPSQQPVRVEFGG